MADATSEIDIFSEKDDTDANDFSKSAAVKTSFLDGCVFFSGDAGFADIRATGGFTDVGFLDVGGFAEI